MGLPSLTATLECEFYMVIKIKKFGTTLISRQLGREALLAFQSVLKKIKKNEKVEIDFTGVTTFSPSWGDEFLTPLVKRYGKAVVFKNTNNPSVKATLEILAEAAEMAIS